MTGLTIVLGTINFTAGANFPTPKDAKVILDAVYEHGVTHIDTAQLYGDAEAFLGDLNAGDRFIIDTKDMGGFNPKVALQPQNLYTNARASLDKMKLKQVDIFYIHGPDDAISPSTWLPVIDKLYQEGVFKRLGLSNFRPEQVREVYDIAKSKGLVLPAVFQGNYSPITRHSEVELFPLLRELDMAFYAYSPLAGGFLAKTKEGLLNGVTEGRFSQEGTGVASLYQAMYFKPALLNALDDWVIAAEEEGVSQAELAYRWVAFHSLLKKENGDAIIIGARNVGQAVDTIQFLKKGPLKDSVVAKIDELWLKVKDDAPVDNFDSFVKGSQSG